MTTYLDLYVLLYVSIEIAIASCHQLVNLTAELLIFNVLIFMDQRHCCILMNHYLLLTDLIISLY